MFCFRYLTSKPFLRDVDDNQILLYARQGYYAFQDYSVQYCLDHFLHHVEQSPSNTTQMLMNGMDSARAFLNSYYKSTDMTGLQDGVSNEWVVPLILGLPKSPRDRIECLDIAHRTVTIRKHVEEVRSQALKTEEMEVINNLYGFQNIFKCPKLWCSYFTTGFSTRKDCKKHVECHERPFCCSEEDCFAAQLGFDTEEKLNKHISRHHSSLDAEVKFPKKLANARPSSIHKAIAKGDVATVLSILDSGVHRNLRDDLLCSAVRFDQFEICKHLLARGAKILQREEGHFESAMDLALRRESLNIVYLFLRQPELSTRQAMQQLPRWIADACSRSHADVSRLLIESPVLEMYKYEPDPLLRAFTSGPSPKPLQCLLEYGFSELVKPDFYFHAEMGDRKDFAALLRPIIDKTHPPYSFQRVESLLGYLGMESWNLSEEQMATMQNLSPDDQLQEAKQYSMGRGFLVHCLDRTM